MAYFWRDLSILYLSHLQWLKLVLQSKKSEIMKNEKSTFSVLFYLKKDKMKKNGLVPIHARITINGKQTQFNTKLEVLETNWQGIYLCEFRNRGGGRKIVATVIGQ